MGLGPPICKKCLCLMSGMHPEPGAYWKCDKCGIDCYHKDSGHLFTCSSEQLDIILKDEPKMRKSLEALRESNRKQIEEAKARHKKRLEEESK